MRTLSILLPTIPQVPAEIIPFAALVRWTNATRLWQGQGGYGSAILDFAFLSGAGMSVPMGIGVNLTPLKHPYTYAQEAQALSRITGHGLSIGFGPGSRAFQRSAMGEIYPDVLTTMEEYIVTIKNLLKTGESNYKGSILSIPRFPVPEIEIGLGVLRPKMAYLAGKIADIAITWLAPPSYLKEILIPEITRGAEEKNRNPPRIVSINPVILRKPKRDPCNIILGTTPHLHGKNYRDMFSRAGVDVTSDSLELTKSLMTHKAILTGTTKQIQQIKEDFFAVGVDELVINTNSIASIYGVKVALEDLGAIFE